MSDPRITRPSTAMTLSRDALELVTGAAPDQSLNLWGMNSQRRWELLYKKGI
jgi:hypothetical protein